VSYQRGSSGGGSEERRGDGLSVNMPFSFFLLRSLGHARRAGPGAVRPCSDQAPTTLTRENTVAASAMRARSTCPQACTTASAWSRENSDY
jgi:hypothetical protein